MTSARSYRLVPTASRERGLPAIGFEMSAPDEIEVAPVHDGTSIVRFVERRADGQTIGELEVRVVAAALIIDRDGILEDKARDAAQDAAHVAVTGTCAVSLPGANGYRADVVVRGPRLPALPYVHVFAMAPDNGIDGCVLVIVRTATPDWPAADALLRSLRILTRSGVAPANDGNVLALPVVARGPRE